MAVAFVAQQRGLCWVEESRDIYMDEACYEARVAILDSNGVSDDENTPLLDKEKTKCT